METRCGVEKSYSLLGKSGSEYLAGNHTKGHVFLAYHNGGASEMAQELKALATMPNRLSPIPRLCMAEGEKWLLQHFS